MIQGDRQLEQIGQAISMLSSKQSVKCILVFTCDKNDFSSSQLEEVLKVSEVPLFGGIFPQIIFENRHYEQGTLLIGLSIRPNVAVIEGLSDPDRDYSEEVCNVCGGNCKTIFVLVDAFASRINDLIGNIFECYGMDLNTIGGGAGSLSMERGPYLFTEKGLIRDGAILASFSISSSVGVRHGWKQLSGPYYVTSSDLNTILTLDDEPAFEVYRRVVEKDIGAGLSCESFFEIAKSYPFGMQRIDAEMVVRDPIIVNDDGSITCVGDVPEGTYLHILKGEDDSLIMATRQACEDAMKDFDVPLKKILFIDCVSRFLFMGDTFTDELDAVCESGIPVIGVLTLGEIANNGNGYLEFYNKTSVVAILEII